nr:unnamed protein product [Naegleria fowleri]
MNASFRSDMTLSSESTLTWNGSSKKRKSMMNNISENVDHHTDETSVSNDHSNINTKTKEEFKVIKSFPNNAAKKTKLSSNEKYLKIQQERKSLPIYSARDALIEEFKKSKTIVVVGETGSGKTTQIPQFIFESGICGEGCIAITQPRRVAAISISRRVSEEMNIKLGEQVGYTIRFEDVSHPQKTRIKYLTDGMLLRESQIDPLLKRYSVIILDEAHERTLHTDVLFGVVKRLLSQRDDLKVIIMSATLEAQAFSKFYDNAKILYVSGRQFPVEIYYTEQPIADYVDAAITTTFQIHLDEQTEQGESKGDILVFLTGQEEIEQVAKLLEQKAQLLPPESLKLMICPIFSALPSEKQMEVFEPAPPGCRKVILATNIAETSITINGIRFVIDTGFVKSKAFNPLNGMESLALTPISKASARQRSGRAGRESSGKCYRLYTEEAYHALDDFTLPEILRCNLSTVVLQLKSMGIDKVHKFDFMDKPPKESLKKSLETLYHLGALDDKGSLTELGVRMAGFPLEPMFAVSLLRSTEFGCTKEVLDIVSMLSVESIFYAPFHKREEANKIKMKFVSRTGDHLTLLTAFREFNLVKKSAKEDIKKWCFDHYINYKSMTKVLEVRKQLRDYLLNMNIEIVSCGKDTTMVRKALCAGFFTNIAVRVPNKRMYRTVTDNIEVRVHPSSVLQDPFPDCVLFNQMILTTKQYIRDVCAIDGDWLKDVVPPQYRNLLGTQTANMLKETQEAKQTVEERTNKNKQQQTFVVKHTP